MLIKICKKYPLILISWSILILYLIVFLLGGLQSMDTIVYQFISSFHSDQMTMIMKAITFIGSWVSVVTICLICVLIERKKGLMISANVAIVHLLNNIIKMIVARERPDVLRLAVETSYSFPSGHSMASFALFGFLAYFVWKKSKGLSVILMMFPIMIGITRIYLGVHYASDVIGGFLFSFVYLCTVIPILRHYHILPDD